MSSNRIRRAQAEAKFYALVGKCIKGWANVEAQLFAVFLEAIGADRRIAAIIFYRMPSIDMRINLISDLIRARAFPLGKESGQHDPPVLARWERLFQRAKSLFPERNFLAHQPAEPFPTKIFYTAGDVEVPEEVHWDLQVLQNWDDHRRQPSKIESMGNAEMKAHHEAVLKLTADLFIYVRELKSFLAAKT